MAPPRHIDNATDDDDVSQLSSEVSDSNISTEILDEQLYFIMKQFLVSESGKNVADCMEEVAEQLGKLVALLSQKST